MKVCSAAFLLVALIAVCSAEVGVPCTDRSQCAADECCQIINIVVMSKKRQLAIGPNTSGTCEKYAQAGDHCSGIAVMNGYCGCASGLTCKTFHVSTTPATVKRSPLAPGWVSLCAPSN